MLEGAELTLVADADGDNSDETGVFDLGTEVVVTFRTRTGDLIGSQGSTAFSVVESVFGDESGRAGFNLDLGGGAFVIELEFQGYEGSSGRWGDGSATAAADAEGEGPFRQLSVLQRYLDVGTYDSASPATLEVGEFSSSGEYDPLGVTPQEPALTFDARESTSVIDGQMTLVRTRDITDVATASNQQNDR